MFSQCGISTFTQVKDLNTSFTADEVQRRAIILLQRRRLRLRRACFCAQTSNTFKFDLICWWSFTDSCWGHSPRWTVPVMDENLNPTLIYLLHRMFITLHWTLPLHCALGSTSQWAQLLLIIYWSFRSSLHWNEINLTAFPKLLRLLFKHQCCRASFILTDDAFWLQLSAGGCFKADSSVKVGWRGVEIETLPFALSHHFWLFDNNNKGRERAPWGRRVVLTQVLPLWGQKDYHIHITVSAAAAEGGVE